MPHQQHIRFRLKSGVKRLGGACARHLLWAPLAKRFFQRRANIVYYHGVWQTGSSALRQFGGLDLETFRDEMRTLTRYFRPVRLEHVLAARANPKDGQDPVVAVTFDDGCDLTRTGATDVLDELGIPATTFVVTACVGNGHLMWQHKLGVIRAACGDTAFVAEFNRLSSRIVPGRTVQLPEEIVGITRLWPMQRKDEYAHALWESCGMPPIGAFLQSHTPYVDWRDLEDWRSRGHSVGLHTRTHPFCSQLTRAEAEVEVIGAARELCDRLGVDAVPFAYPFGDRFAPDRAAEIADRAPVTCLLGIDGLSPVDTSPRHLGRARGESGLDAALFCRPLIAAVQMSSQ